MKIGIVGSEGAKFTPLGEAAAKRRICAIVASSDAVCSGECHLGGIDIWAHEAADAQRVPFQPFPPKSRTWNGYKARNLQIAEWSDLVICITVARLPTGFKEGGWERYCYHCKTDKHIKSGGCWTMHQALEKGKDGYVIVVSNADSN